MARLCTPVEITVLQSAVGNVIWTNSSTKRNISFHTFWIASRVVGATIRDLFNALYLLKFIIQEKNVPLILGGAGPISYHGMCDCSLGTGPKGRSIINWCGFLNELSGAVASYTQSTHFAVVNISHGETESMVKLTHLLLYIRNVAYELALDQRVSPPPVRVLGDNMASINWVHGGPTSTLSRHLDARIMAVRRYEETGDALYDHIPTNLNTADAGTKVLGPSFYGPHSRNIQGHRLVDNLFSNGVKVQIRGVKPLEDIESDDIALSEVLFLMQSVSEVEEINWTPNDYALSYAFANGINTIVEDQPLLMLHKVDSCVSDLA